MYFSTLFLPVAALVSGVLAAPAPAPIHMNDLQKRTPPNIPTKASAVSMLANLPTRTTDATGYGTTIFLLPISNA